MVEIGDQRRHRFDPRIACCAGEVLEAILAYPLDVFAKLAKQRGSPLLDGGLQFLGLLLGQGHAATPQGACPNSCLSAETDSRIEVRNFAHLLVELPLALGEGGGDRDTEHSVEVP